MSSFVVTTSCFCTISDSSIRLKSSKLVSLVRFFSVSFWDIEIAVVLFHMNLSLLITKAFKFRFFLE